MAPAPMSGHLGSCPLGIKFPNQGFQTVWLITGGQSDNQPVVKNGIIVLHNGIIVNPEKLWEEVSSNRELEVDSEILAALCEDYLKSNRPLEGLSDFILSKLAKLPFVVI